MRGWRPALLIAWRDALRHRGRSALVLVMISLPVLGVSAAAVVITTAEVSGIEGADRAMGAADARVRTEGRGPVVQAPDPDRVGWSPLGEVDIDDPLTEDDLRAVLGHDARLVPITEGSAATRLDDRVFDFSTTGVDLSDPIAEGLFELEAGRLPEADGEVVVNGPMLDKGLAVGDELEIAGTELRIVGAGRDASAYDRPVVLGSAQDLPSGSTHVREWLVDAGPVSWAQVRELNAVGGVVTSRAVLADPPDVATMAEHLGHDTGQDETYAVVALIVVMALIEVVLLAGPAFAVGARRHARTLALIAASGGTPAQARRVILGSGVVLGLVASGVGLVLGVLAGWALLPLVQRFSGDWFGPFEAPWPYLAATTAFGLVSAVLASVVPAWLASRQDVVAVLAGRRGDRRPRTSTPVVGLALLGAGVAASAYGAVTSDSGNGAFWIAGAAVVSVLGMILVVPVVVATVARLAGRLPLTARYAARDAERHRTRTVPAVAAVAATVAGVVALGIANASDERQNEATYWPQAPMGTGLVSWGPNVLPGEETPDPEPVWRSIEQVVREAAPEAVLQRTHSLAETYDAAGWTSSHVRLPSEIEDGEGWGLTVHGPSVAVSDTAAGAGVVGDVGAEVDEALAAGRTVVFTRDTAGEVEAELVQERWQDGSEQAVDSEAHRLDAVMLPWDEATQGPAPASTILPTAVTTNLGLEVEIRDLRFAGDIDEATQTRITEAVGGVVDGTYTYVERGYVRPDEATVVLLVLGGLGGLLMLGGTLTATFLALSDARPDLATLSAVGAAPRTRRRVAAAYAIVVGLVGSVLGAVVGFIPGVAISRPLTAVQTGPTGESGPYLAIPWLLIAVIVIALPLLTAVVVGLTARSRLPLVARLD